jgi:broad specificity phosphatase PhoE
MQKKPFYVFVSLLVLSACLLMACSTTITPVYLLRHAEKQLGIDPDLTPAGTARAQELKRILKNVPVKAIYTTNASRTRQTVQPLATDKGLSPITYSGTSIAGTILSQHKEQVVVIVGHSPTVPALIRGFDGDTTNITISEMEYDNLFLLIVKQTKRGTQPTRTDAEVLHMKYGDESP